jgi:hypothetical protein
MYKKLCCWKDNAVEILELICGVNNFGSDVTHKVGKKLHSKLSLYDRIIDTLRIALNTRKKKTNIFKFFELAILQTLLSGIES